MENYKKMYKGFSKTKITRQADEVGNSLEEELRQATTSKKPLEMTSELIYTNAKDGVLPQHDVRTDKQEIAIEIANKHEASDAMRGQLEGDEEEKKTEEVKQPKVE